MSSDHPSEKPSAAARPVEPPVDTVPTGAAAKLTPRVVATVFFDVADLERCTAFYCGVLGFRVARTERAGMVYETRVMVSDRYPGVALFARRTFQRPVLGSMIGGVVQVGLRDPDLAARATELEGRVAWVLAPGQGEGRLSFLDPDGYVVELFG
jgi:catechol 2,3-dioxygenase-like lactoylglutathione lyase family enzyme